MSITGASIIFGVVDMRVDTMTSSIYSIRLDVTSSPKVMGGTVTSVNIFVWVVLYTTCGVGYLPLLSIYTPPLLAMS